MDLTRYEKRLLDPRFPGRNRVVLITAILLLAAAVFVLVFGSRYTEKVRRPYQDMMVRTQKIVIQSPREDVLKQSLIQTIEVAEQGWFKYAESVRKNVFELLLFFGTFLLLIYWQNMRIHRLLKKLKLPPNNSLQTNAKSCVG